jgi:hypothetical protein
VKPPRRLREAGLCTGDGGKGPGAMSAVGMARVGMARVGMARVAGRASIQDTVLASRGTGHISLRPGWYQAWACTIICNPEAECTVQHSHKEGVIAAPLHGLGLVPAVAADTHRQSSSCWLAALLCMYHTEQHHVSDYRYTLPLADMH